MAATITPASLKSLLEGKTPFALIDVREAGEYNSSHIPGSSLIARRQLEFAVPPAVPFKGTPLVVCDDDGRRAALAARTLERLGYRQVSVLDGGINRGHGGAADRVGHERSEQGLRREGGGRAPRPR